MKDFLMMTQTPQLRKIATKKRASYPSSIREPDLGFRKQVEKLEQAETTMKLEETQNIRNSEHQKNPKFKGKPSIKLV